MWYYASVAWDRLGRNITIGFHIVQMQFSLCTLFGLFMPHAYRMNMFTVFGWRSLNGSKTKSLEVGISGVRKV